MTRQWIGHAGLCLLLAAGAVHAEDGTCIATNKPSCFSQACLDAYQAALDDALNPEPSEVSTDLTSILNPEDSPGLTWTTANGYDYVKVVSWKSTHSAAAFETGDDGFYTTGSGEIWVTLVPEVQDLCKQWDPVQMDVDLRLRQLMGLQPCGDYSTFVTLWVLPTDLRRPCPDNEVSDATCGLSLPGSVAEVYRTWFNETRAQQYVPCKCASYSDSSCTACQKWGWPWTQLGYTYDWGNQGDDFGVSEFLIWPDSMIMVGEKFLTADYCT